MNPFKLVSVILGVSLGIAGQFAWADALPKPVTAATAEMVVQTGHSQPITQVAYSATGRFVVTAGQDNAVKIWTPDGRLLRTIDRLDILPSFAITKDEQELLIGSGRGRLELWSVQGELKQRFPALPGYAGAVAVSPDGEFVIGCNRVSKENYCEVFSPAGKSIARLTHPPMESVDRVVVSPDSRYIYTAAFKTVRKWGRDGALLKEFPASDQAIGSLDVSPDGTRLLTIDSTDSIALLIATQGHDERIKGKATTRLWDTNGKLLREIPSHDSKSAHFSADGHWIVSGGRSDNRVLVHDLAGKLVKQFSVGSTARTSPVQIALAPDMRRIVTADDEFTPPGLKLWSIDGAELGRFNQFNASINDMAMDTSGNVFATVSADGYVRLWAITGRLLGRFQTNQDYPERILISPNGRTLATAASDLTVWSASGERLARVNLHKNGTHAMEFTPDGQTLISGGGDGYVNIIPLKDPKNAKHFKAHGGERIYALAIHPSGKIFATGSSWERVRIWDTTGKQLASFELPKETKPPFSNVNAMQFTPDGKQLVVMTTRHGAELRFFDLDARVVRTLSAPITHQGVGAVAISPSGRWLAASVGRQVGLWDLTTFKFQGYLNGHNRTVSSLHFREGERHLISASNDGMVRVWNLENDQSFAMISHDHEWVMFTDDGLFDASKYGADMIAMVDGLNAYGVEQFALYNNRPDLIYRRIGIGDEELIHHLELHVQKRLQRSAPKYSANAGFDAPRARILDLRQEGKSARLSVELNDSRGLKAMQVFVNGVPLYPGSGKPVKGRVAKLEESVELGAGRNKIEISAVNEIGVESLRATASAHYDKPVQGDFYFVGIGVSKFQDQKLNLRYADKDAVDLERLMQRYQGRYAHVHTLSLLNDQATRASFERVREFVKPAGIDDTVIVFVSGHGTYDLTTEATYYYITYDTEIGRLAETAVPYAKLEGLMAGVRARKKLLLLDTCESGELGPERVREIRALADKKGLDMRTSAVLVQREAMARPRPFLYAKDRYLYNDLNRRTGAIVFSSSEGGELSFEHPSIQNGFFTEAVITALTSAEADRDKNGSVSMAELEAFVRGRVAINTANLQHPTIDRDNIEQDFSLPLLSGAPRKPAR